MNLCGQHILVTGATGGIGKAVCEAVAKAGATKLAVSGRSVEKLTQLATQLARAYPEVVVQQFAYDQESPEQNSSLVQQAYSALGGLDAVICNAGCTRDKMAKNLPVQAWQQVIDVNLTGPFLQSQAAIKLSAAATSTDHTLKRIVFITSVIGHTGNIGQVNYAASKAGLTAVCKTLAQEGARSKITVNCVAPGFIETAMTNGLDDKIKAHVTTRIPLQRFGVPTEVAHAVVFLLTPDAAYITGNTVHVNGGLLMD